MSGSWCACKSPLFLWNFSVLSSKYLIKRRNDDRISRWIFRKSGYGSSNLTLCSQFDFPTHFVRKLPISVVNRASNGRNYSTAPEFTSEPASNDEKDDDFTTNKTSLNDYTLRSHSCGELRSLNIGQKVKLCGWVSYVRMNKFIILRDYYGVTQIILPESVNSCLGEVHLETVICVSGIVRARPPAQVRKHQDTGEIEVHASSVEIINNALASLPFQIRKYQKVNSPVANRHRFLALRFHEIQSNLRLRSEVLFRMREFLITKKKFVEVETPTLFKKTPGGAQEFIVPTHEENKFYSLVQSPQQFKQLLMVGSVDRYFQIARCYRDEGTTSERQPEFTQLDIELSFTDADEVMKLTEDVLVWSWPHNKVVPRLPFPKMRYQHAIENYGSDKPCLLDKFLIQDMKPCMTEATDDHCVYMFIVPRGKPSGEKLKAYLKTSIGEKCAEIHIIAETTIQKICDKLADVVKGFDLTKYRNYSSLQSDDLIILAKGPQKMQTLETLGFCRHHVINTLGLIEQMNAKGIYDFLWIVDFPLFEEKADGKLKSSHHPFTQPHPDDLHLLSSDPLKVRSLAYDLVLNGSEIGGGSIRIHDTKLQAEILNILEIPKSNFAHMLEAFQMGCPSHGGIALGIDRLMAILCNCASIKDVIAFPKGSNGQDLMTECPSDVPDEDKIRYHIPITK